RPPPRSPAAAGPATGTRPLPGRREAVALGAEAAARRPRPGPGVADVARHGPRLGDRHRVRRGGEPDQRLAGGPGGAARPAAEALRAAPLPELGGPGRRSDPGASAAGDGPARRRLRAPGPEARHLPGRRAPGPVRDGLQALLRRGPAPDAPRRRAPDPP